MTLAQHLINVGSTVCFCWGTSVYAETTAAVVLIPLGLLPDQLRLPLYG